MKLIARSAVDAMVTPASLPCGCGALVATRSAFGAAVVSFRVRGVTAYLPFCVRNTTNLTYSELVLSVACKARCPSVDSLASRGTSSGYPRLYPR